MGADFLDAIEETTCRIQLSPMAGPVEKVNIRKRFVSGFPFTILYEVQLDRIYIAAVMHQHRRPAYWQKRVD